MTSTDPKNKATINRVGVGYAATTNSRRRIRVKISTSFCSKPMLNVVFSTVFF